MTALAGSIQILYATASSLASNNYVLKAGQEAHESDTGKRKIGDGTTAYNALSYLFTTGGVTGSGTNGKFTKWTGTSTLGDSAFSESGTQIVCDASSNSIEFNDGGALNINSNGNGIITDGLINNGTLYNNGSLFNRAGIYTGDSTHLGFIQFYNGSNNFITKISAGVAGANIFYRLPIVAPTAGQILSSDGSGNWSWVTPASGISGLTLNKYSKAASATTLTDALLSDDGTNVIVPNGKYITGADITKARISFGSSGSALLIQPTAGSNNTNFSIQNNAISFQSGDGGVTPTISQVEYNRQYLWNTLYDLSSGSRSGFAVQDNSGGLLSMEGGVQIKLATGLTAVTENSDSRWGLFLNAKNGSYNVGVKNSVVFGSGRVAAADYTAYFTNADIAGTLKYVDGNQAAGKFLQSDVNGVATWQSISGLLSGLTATYFPVASSGTNIVNSAFTQTGDVIANATAGNSIDFNDGGAGITIDPQGNVVTINGSLVSAGAMTNSQTISSVGVIIGVANTSAGEITLYNSSNANTLSIRSGATGASITYTLPIVAPTTGQVLSSTSGGTMSWISALPLSGGTMTGDILFSGGKGIDTTGTVGTDTIYIGSTNADVINIGRVGATVNILGSVIHEYATNAYVTDKLITINSGGGASTAAGAGLEIEENSIITGYIKTNGARDAYSFLAPGIAYSADISLASLTANRVYTLPNVTGTFVTTGDTGTVTNTMLAGSIAYSKLSLTGAILNADLAGSIAYSKLTLTGSIVNADVNAAAAIAYSKLNLTGAILNADLAGGIAYSKLSLTGAILNADLAGSIAAGKITLASAKILVGTGGGVAAEVTMSGDVTNDNTGVQTIAANAVTYTKSYNGNQLAIVNMLRVISGN